MRVFGLALIALAAGVFTLDYVKRLSERARLLGELCAFLEHACARIDGYAEPVIRIIEDYFKDKGGAAYAIVRETAEGKRDSRVLPSLLSPEETESLKKCLSIDLMSLKDEQAARLAAAADYFRAHKNSAEGLSQRRGKSALLIYGAAVIGALILII